MMGVPFLSSPGLPQSLNPGIQPSPGSTTTGPSPQHPQIWGECMGTAPAACTRTEGFLPERDGGSGIQGL